MRLDIRGGNITLDEDIREHVDRRLRFSLGRFGTRIRRVAVRVADVNGPRGGVDKRCRISLTVQPRGEVVIDEVSTDLLHAIDRAADRAGRATEREIARLREHRL